MLITTYATSPLYFKQLFINQISCQTLNLTKYFLILSGRLDSNQHPPRSRRGRFKPISVLPVILHTFQFFFLLASNIICKNSAITTNMPFVTFAAFISNHFMYYIFFFIQKRKKLLLSING